MNVVVCLVCSQRNGVPCTLCVWSFDSRLRFTYLEDSASTEMMCVYETERKKMRRAQLPDMTPDVKSAFFSLTCSLLFIVVNC